MMQQTGCPVVYDAAPRYKCLEAGMHQVTGVKWCQCLHDAAAAGVAGIFMECHQTRQSHVRRPILAVA